MKRFHGFTLIELLIFIIVSSILTTSIMLAFVAAVRNSENLRQSTIATLTAKQCADWFLSKRRLQGFDSVSGSNCTGTLSIPSICSTPSGYAITGNCSSTTLSGDSNYVTITLSVTGPSNADMTLLLGGY